MTPSDPFGLVGQVLDGQFRVEKLVGEGGFSAVYRGHHLGLDEPVAVKCLKLPPALGAQLVDSFVQRFRDESRILYRLSQGNLHIVRSIGAGATKATNQGMVVPYMVLEWLEGRSMANDFTVRKTLGKSGRTLDEVLSLFSTAADALAFAHAQGVVHRDLNPGNLFLAKTPQGEKMKVLDFGVAKILDDTTLNLGPRAQTMGQIRIFAPAYGSPEQFDDAMGAVASQSDVYSFSLVLLEALRDKPVNDGSNLGEFATAAVDANKRPTPRSLGLNLPDPVEQVFVKATKLKPADRYAHVGEFWKAFEMAVGKGKPASTVGRSTATGLGGSPPLSKTMPLNSPNLAGLARPSPGLPSKASQAPVPASPTATAKTKVAPAPGSSPQPTPGASPLSTSLPGVGNAKAPAMNPALGATAPATQRFNAAGGAAGLPPPPARPLIQRTGAGTAGALGGPPGGAAPKSQTKVGIGLPAPNAPAASNAGAAGMKPPPASSPLKRAAPVPSEPPLYENEEVPTRVGQSISTDALPSEPPKAGIPRMHKDEEEEEDVTRVRAPEEDLLAAAAAAAANVNPNAPPGSGASSGKPERPSPIPPPPDSGHTLMMPPGGGGIPIPSSSPEPPLMQPPPPPAPGTALPLGANMLAGPGSHAAPAGHHGGLGSTVAIAHGGSLGALASGAPGGPPPQQNPAVLSGISDLRPTPYQPLQQPPQYPPGQNVQSAPFGAGTPQMGVPAHFAQAQAPAQFQQSAFPTGAHAQPASTQQTQPAGKAPLGLIIAAAAFLVIGIGGVALFLLMGRNPAPTENGTPSAMATPVPVPSPTPVITAPPVVDPNAGSTAPPPVADNSGAAAPPDPTPPAPTEAPTNAAPTPINPIPNSNPNPNPGPTAVNPGPTPINPGTTAVPVPKPTPSAAPAVDPNAWNEGAARARLAQANGVLVFCKKPDEPTGPGSASVTFSPEGTVTSVTVDPPYAGTKAGDCVAGQFKRAKVNAFQGTSQTIKHNFEVPK